MQKVLRLSFLFSITLGLQSAYALETWSGDKFLYSVSDQSDVAMKVTLNEDSTAQITSTRGTAEGFYTVQNKQIFINLQKKKLSHVVFQDRVNPSTGRIEQLLSLIHI